MKKFFIFVFLISSCYCSNLIAQNSEQINSIKNLSELKKQHFIAKSIGSFNLPESQSYSIDSSKIMKILKKKNLEIEIICNEHVRKYLNLYLNQEHDNLCYAYSLYQYYQKDVDNTLKKLELPSELFVLPIAFSASDNTMISSNGAKGLWNLTYTISKHYGVKINSWYDYRSDSKVATLASLSLLKNFNNIYGEWELAVAAYTMGASNVNKAIRRANGSLNYWDIYKFLPQDQREIVPAYMALVIILNDTERYNIKTIDIQIPEYIETTDVKEKVHFKQISELIKIPYEELKFYNPIYRHDIIPCIENGKKLCLPMEYMAKFHDMEDSIYHHNDSLYFKPKPSKDIARYAKRGSATVYPNDNRGGGSTVTKVKGKDAVYYTIRSGDNLGAIASKFKVNVKDIQRWNNLNGTKIIAGKKLIIHVSKSKANKYKTSPSSKTSSKNNSSTTTKKSGSGSWVYYTVKSGDSPYSISQKYSGVSPDDIMKWNNITNARNIKVGQKLKIKKQ